MKGFSSFSINFFCRKRKTIKNLWLNKKKIEIQTKLFLWELNLQNVRHKFQSILKAIYLHNNNNGNSAEKQTINLDLDNDG